MSDEGEKTCPLCAEEMDLTDQQLKACRCGYEVCVWCWNHILEMAEKDGTEGRCPACRTPYDKEKIVGMAANCGRLVAEGSTEKRHKSQKAKSKTSESRKQLTNVRVIQRNLVYIVGLPLDLADEDLLQHEEYFGQYGKVLKVSISRTSAGTIQQFANSTCSVYITYAREDEAMRCIQSVHAFILDDRPLRACFGTTKYCHAWLRNMPCNNPDCLYLHEIGSHEDSFTKDEIVSAYSIVQQITGITNNMQQRSGNYLPPPADDYCCNSSTLRGNPEVKSPSNNSVSDTRSSPPSSSSGRSGALPAAASWGARASNCKPSAGTLASSNAPAKQKAEAIHRQRILASVASASPQTTDLPNEKKHVSNEEGRQTKSKMEALDTVKQHAGLNSNVSVSKASITASATQTVKPKSQAPSSMPADSNEGEDCLPLNTRHSINEESCSLSKQDGASSTDVNLQKLSVGVSSIHMDKQPNGEFPEVLRPVGLTLDTFMSHRDHGLECHDPEKSQERLLASGNAAASVTSLTGRSELCNLSSDVQTPAVQNLTSETEDDFDSQRLRDAIVSQAPMSATSPLHMLSQLRFPVQPQADADCVGNYSGSPPIAYQGPVDGSGINSSSASAPSNGFLEHLLNRTADQGNSFVNGTLGNCSGQFNGELTHFDLRPTSDMGESSIISNILSLDLDSWDDTLTSHQNLAKLIGENDKQDGSIKSASRKSQNSNQSRFSFARQEDSRKYLFDMEPTLGSISHPVNNLSFDQQFVENRDSSLNKLGNGFGFQHRNMEYSDKFFGGHSTLPSNQFPVSRSQISAPPGFSVPSRPPPPGFSSNERSYQNLDFLISGNQLHETSSFGRNPYQTSHSGNTVSYNDIEFIDPAILAVGKGSLPTGFNSSAIDMGRNFHVQTPGLDDELRLQLLMQRALSPHQNLRNNDVRYNLSAQNDTSRFPSQHTSLEQPRHIVSDGQWKGWSEAQLPNDMGIAELLRNDRVGLDKLYGGYEDSKCRMTNTGDLYNRSFGL
ncbi:hypothetical protein vseg_015202 [Gypsophila vaccaria]